MTDHMTPDQEQNRKLFADVDFGMEIEAFLRSKVGKYLLARAEDDREKGVAELLEADPSNMAKILQLQSQVKRADSIQQWMAEAIQQGTYAQQQLMEQDE